jgi:hypothetical protein
MPPQPQGKRAMTGKERSQRWRDRHPKIKPKSERDRLREEAADERRVQSLVSFRPCRA